MALNQITIEGRLTRDPERITTHSGTQMVRFTVAVDRNRKNAEGEYDTDFFSCVAFGDRADWVLKYMKKGYPIIVSGSCEIQRYTDKNGTDRTGVQIIVDKTWFILRTGQRQDGTPSGAGADGPSVVPAPADLPDDSIFGDDIDPSFVPMDEADLPF